VVERVVVVVCGVVLLCWVTVVTVRGVVSVVLVVLSQKNEVRDIAMIKLEISMSKVLFMGELYPRKSTPTRG
jgi:hypothetical protein